MYRVLTFCKSLKRTDLGSVYQWPLTFVKERQPDIVSLLMKINTYKVFSIKKPMPNHMLDLTVSLHKTRGRETY